MPSGKELFNLEGKAALVTGAALGLGRSFAQTLAEGGADVAIADIDQERLSETEEIIKEVGGKALKIVADVSNPANVARMVEETVSTLGRLDIAVNNAGIVHKPYRFHETPLEEWHRLMAINMTGVFTCMQRELEWMIGQKGGVIINIASILGLRGLPPEFMPRVSYVAAKHAVIGLTKQAALEYAGDGIRVNAIAPGWFEGTDIARERLAGVNEEHYKERTQKIIEATPMKRRGRVQELMGLLLYLASDASSFVTGQTFTIDGGWTAY
ncbi:MAG: glucose 1-dehydrogenase [Desulfobacteraceae bacterium]|jgi:gluconate 5-dehydrogenase